jgi:hypothetical protein
VAISNITIKGVTVPLFMRLGHRARTYGDEKPKPGVGTFRNVVVSNIVATDCSPIGCAIEDPRKVAHDPPVSGEVFAAVLDLDDLIVLCVCPKLPSLLNHQ